jgi:curli production assembly/transport component CsgF
MSKRLWTVVAVIAVGIDASAPAFASELVYHPVNPTFGGNPLNGSFLLSTAQAQGEGAKSGAQSPDLSGLTNALSNLGTNVGGSGTSGNNGSGSSVSGGSGGSGGGTTVVVIPP